MYWRGVVCPWGCFNSPVTNPSPHQGEHPLKPGGGGGGWVLDKSPMFAQSVLCVGIGIALSNSEGGHF